MSGLREALEGAVTVVEQGIARSTRPDREGFLMTSHVRQILAAYPDLCHNGHPFEPGVDTDMEAEGRTPDPRWCNVCGEARQAITDAVVDGVELAAAKAMFAEEQCDRRQREDVDANWNERLDDDDRAEYRRLARAALTAAGQMSGLLAGAAGSGVGSRAEAVGPRPLLDREAVKQALLAVWLREAEAKTVDSPEGHCDRLAGAVLALARPMPTRETLAAAVDPEAFDETRQRSAQPAAVVQWAARQHMAYSAADAVLVLMNGSQL
jgi:hypothetical protein